MAWVCVAVAVEVGLCVRSVGLKVGISVPGSAGCQDMGVKDRYSGTPPVAQPAKEAASRHKTTEQE